MHTDGLHYMKRRLHHINNQSAIKLFCEGKAMRAITAIVVPKSVYSLYA